MSFWIFVLFFSLLPGVLCVTNQFLFLVTTMSPVDLGKAKRKLVRRSQSLPREQHVSGSSASGKDCLSEAMDQAFNGDGLDEQQQQQQRGEKEKPKSDRIVIERDEDFSDNMDSMDEFDLMEKASQGIEYVPPKTPLGTQNVVISIPANQMGLWDAACAEGAAKEKAKEDERRRQENEAASAGTMATIAKSIALDADKIHSRSLGVGMERHDFPVVGDEDLQRNGQSQEAHSGPYRVTFPEMVLPGCREFMRTIDVTGDGLEFVMITRRDESEEWYLPSMQVFADVINMVQMKILMGNMDMASVLFDTKNWGGVRVMILRVSSVLSLARWRSELTKIDHEGREYNSFPKCSLQAKNNQVSMLLRDGLRYFRLEWLSLELKKRNALKGKIAVVFSKVYGPKEKTRLGVSKDGWKLVIANVDDVFLRSLRAFSPGHSFKVGASTVLIRELSSDYMPIIPPGSAATRIVPCSQPQVQPREHVYEVNVPVVSNQFQSQQQQHQPQPQPQSSSQDQPRPSLLLEPPAGVGSEVAFDIQAPPEVPDLLMSITSPVPPDQARLRSGPGSRGGRGRRARDAASAAARRAYNAM